MSRLLSRYKNLIFVVAILLLLIVLFLWPHSLSGSIATEGGYSVLSITDDLEIDDETLTAKPALECSQYTRRAGSEKCEALCKILSRYSYHLTLDSVLNDASIEGNNAGYWIQIYGVQSDSIVSLISNGAGEIILNGRGYRVGYFGNEKAVALMGEIQAVLTTCTPEET